MTRTFTLTLSMPTTTPPNEPNGFQRLRQLLKCLLRSYVLKCVNIQEQNEPIPAIRKDDENER